jgi:hypothetical protein
MKGRGIPALFFGVYSSNTRAGDRTRTYDMLITNQLLYQLSYAGLGTWTRRGRNPFRRPRQEEI